MKYLTIAEFADRAGVTSQSVYQRIKRNGLEEYIVTSEDGVKRISEDALKLYSNSKNKKQLRKPRVTHHRLVRAKKTKDTSV